MPKRVIQYDVSFLRESRIDTYKSAALVHTTIIKERTHNSPMTARLHYLVDESKGKQMRFYAPIPEELICYVEGITKKRIIHSYVNCISAVIYLVDVTNLKLNFPVLDPIEPNKDKAYIIKEAVENLICIADPDGAQKPFLSSETKRLFMELAEYVKHFVNEHNKRKNH